MTMTLTDAFWSRYHTLIKDEMIPYQWSVLNDEADITIDKERDDDFIPSEKSHALENLRIAAGQSKGHHYGWLFQDSDVYKWLESAANSYALTPDDTLMAMMEEVVKLIEEAQDDDGYLSTFYQIDAPHLKFRRLFESHELYCAGHLFEAAAAYYKATDDRRLLDVSEKLVACIRENFGSEEGKINGADGHQEVEIGLVKLYEVTGKTDFIDLSKWFLDIRGQDPDFYKKQLKENEEMGLEQKLPGYSINPTYYQVHQTVYEQEEAVGHAVRLVYIAAAMAEVAHIRDDQKLFQAAKRLWDNIVKKRVYITGGIGSTVHGEAFTFDFDLPNDSMYCETCASIGLLYFSRAMMNHDTDRDYAEIMERTLYNSIISGMAPDGKHFFYVNPLESDPKAHQYDPGKSHVKPVRPSWFGCACCPPNLARTLTSLNRYVVSHNDESISIHLYSDFDASIDWKGETVGIRLESSMPYEGQAKLSVSLIKEPVTLALREPSWSKSFTVYSSADPVETYRKNDYVHLVLSEDTEISLTFDMPVIEWQSHPSVKHNKGKVALQRGPFIYCLEEEDNGDQLHLLSLKETPVIEAIGDDVLGEIVLLKGRGSRNVITEEWTESLYLPYKHSETEEVELTFIPYHLWANRSKGEMRVWIDRD